MQLRIPQKDFSLFGEQDTRPGTRLSVNGAAVRIKKREIDHVTNTLHLTCVAELPPAVPYTSTIEITDA